MFLALSFFNTQRFPSERNVFLCGNFARSLHRQRGFSLIEISIVTTIMMLLAIVGIPAIQGYVVESKVPRVAEELQRFVARLKVTTHGFGASPYASVDTRVLANSLRGSSVVAVSGEGAGADVAHGLGGPGVSGRGVVRIAPYALSGAPFGSAFLLTLNDVNHAACPGLASILQRIADVVRISGAAGPVTVKDSLHQPVAAYNPLLADAQCLNGDRNVFEFVIR